jgi:predicted aspartyl protease
MGEPWKRIRLLVDTKAFYTTLPRHVVESLQIQPSRRESFQVRGRVLERELGFAYVRYGAMVSPTPVIFGMSNDLAVLGRLTLDELWLEVDPKARRLRAKRDLPLMSIVPA